MGSGTRLFLIGPMSNYFTGRDKSVSDTKNILIEKVMHSYHRNRVMPGEIMWGQRDTAKKCLIMNGNL